MSARAERILVVEDEEYMARGLRDNLEAEGYQVTVATDGQQALRLAATRNYSLVLLDIMLPEISGYDVCRKLREQKVDTPIIVISAKGEELDRVLGLELGADDYVSKPFGIRELLARIKAVLRRRHREPGIVSFKFGDTKIDFHRMLITQKGGEIPLSYYECAILRLLVESKGVPVSRSQILNEIWGPDAYPITRTVDNHIMKLRKKLEPNPSLPRHILTMHGLGYKFVP